MLVQATSGFQGGQEEWQVEACRMLFNDDDEHSLLARCLRAACKFDCYLKEDFPSVPVTFCVPENWGRLSLIQANLQGARANI